MLDDFIPEPLLVEIDEVEVEVPPAQAYEAARNLDLSRSFLVRALFSLRSLPDRGPDRVRGGEASSPSMTIADIGGPDTGFLILEDRPGYGIAVGSIGRFWKPKIEFAATDPSKFGGFDEAGWGKLAWALRFEPSGERGTRIVFELRLAATDDTSWRSLRRYFAVIGPFSHFIRRHVLSLLEEDLGTAHAQAERRPLAGDEIIENPKGQLTHEITIDATPDAIWPWLVQMGCGRGGWYSYDRLDNAGIPSARELVPALQEIAVGDALPATPDGKEVFHVYRVEPSRALVLGGIYDLDGNRSMPEGSGPLPERYWRVTWAFDLEPLGETQTRLWVRARADYGPTDAGKWRAIWMRPVHHFMQTQQLRGLKRRAEGTLPRKHDTWKDVGEGIVGALGILANLTTPFLRPLRNHWGLSKVLAERTYPGDGRIAHPAWGWTHGIEIDAPPTRVWPWIAQIGQDKGGFYSYQWLENLAGCDIQNVDHVDPSFGDPKVGDGLRLAKDMEPAPIVEVESGRYFLVHGEMDPATGGERSGDAYVRLTWLFFVEPLEDGRSRVVSRFRSAYSDELRTRLLYGPYLTESIGFVMDRKMLRGIKARVEREIGKA